MPTYAPPFHSEVAETSWNTGGASKASAAFTPPNDSLLVAVGAAADKSSSSTQAFSSAPALTWTTRASNLYVSNACPVIASTAPVASGVSMTATLTYNAALADLGFDVLAFVGHGGVGAAVISSGPQANAPSISITTTQDNSAVVLLLADWNAGTWAARSWLQPAGTSSFIETATAQTVAGQYSTVAGYYPNAGPAGTKTLGLPTLTGTWTVVAVEVKGTDGNTPLFCGSVADSLAATAHTVTNDRPIPAGTRLFAKVDWVASTAVTLNTFTGGALTWSRVGGIAGGAGAENMGIDLWTAVPAATVAPGTTFTGTLSGAPFAANLTLFHHLNAQTANIVDGTIVGTARTSPTAAVTTPSTTIASADDDLYFFALSDGPAGTGGTAFSVSAPWTEPWQELKNASNDWSSGTAFQRVTSPGSYSASGAWGVAPTFGDISMLVAIKNAGAAVPSGTGIGQGTIGGGTIGVRAGGATAYTRSTGDTATASEALARQAVRPRALADTATAGDALARQAIRPRALADAAPAADATARAAARPRAAADAAPAADAAARAAASGRGTSDSAPAVDAVARAVARARATGDFITTGSSYRSVVLRDQPMGWWRFGETSGTTAADQLGARPGTYLGPAALGFPGALVQDQDTAVFLDGINGAAVQVLNPPVPTTAITLEAWAMDNGGEANARILDRANTVTASPFSDYNLMMSAGPGNNYWGMELGLSDGTYRSCLTGNPVAFNVFHHFVGTWDGSEFRLYVDGVLDHVQADAGPAILDRGMPLYFGRYGADPGIVRGLLRLDEAAIYGYALTGAQVAEHYAAGLTSMDALLAVKASIIVRGTDDVAPAADSAVRVAARARGLADSALASDALVRAASRPRALTDVALASDAMTRARAATRAVAEAAPAADALARALAAIRAPTDTAPAADAVTRLAVTVRALADVAAAADAVTRARVAVRALADVAPAADAALRSGTTARGVADSAPASDAAARQTALARGLPDAAPAADATVRGFVGARLLADSAPVVSDLANKLGAAITRSTADAAPASDTLARLRAAVRGLADSAPASDTLSRLTGVLRAAGDTALAADVATRVASFVRATPGGGGSGYMAEVRADTPRAYWPMTGAGASQAEDAGGPALVLTGATPGVPGATPQLGTAVSFNGVNNWGRVAALDLSASNKVTVEMWLLWDVNGADDSLALEHGESNQAKGFALDPSSSSTGGGGWTAFTPDSQSNQFTEERLTGRPSAATWHHIVVCIDRTVPGSTGGVFDFYVDGVHDAGVVSGAFAPTGLFQNYPLMVMARSAPGDGTKSLLGAGDMQHLAIYDGVLSAARVAAHYAARGTASTGGDVATAADAVATQRINGIVSRSTGDAAPAADAVLRAIAAARAVADAAPVSEAVARVASFKRAGADNAPAADALARAVARLRSLPDSAPVTDALLRAAVLARAVADSAPAADALTRAAALARAAADSAPAADALTRAGALARALADAAPASDAVAVLRVRLRGTADAVTGSDAVTRVLARAKATADAVTGTDAVARTVAAARATADAAPAVDSVTKALARLRPTADAAPATDALTYTTGKGISTTDAAPAADAATRRAAYGRAPTDAAPAADALARMVAAARAVTDTAPAADLVSRVSARLKQTADSAPASDALARVRDAVRGTADSSPATDGVAQHGSYGRGLVDSAPAQDTPNRALAVARGLTDAAPAADVVVGVVAQPFARVLRVLVRRRPAWARIVRPAAQRAAARQQNVWVHVVRPVAVRVGSRVRGVWALRSDD